MVIVMTVVGVITEMLFISIVKNLTMTEEIVMDKEGQHKKEHYQTERLKLTNNQIAFYCGNIPFKNEVCDVCHGSGIVGDGTCSSCNGRGEL